jgi:hypothetical protein
MPSFSALEETSQLGFLKIKLRLLSIQAFLIKYKDL